MKKSILILMLLLAAGFVSAQETEKTYTHGQVAAIGFVPYAATGIAIGTNPFLPQKARTFYLAGISLLGNIPACITNSPRALSETAIEAGTIATGYALYKFPEFSDAAFNIGWKSTWWTQYDAYANARSKCDFYPDYEKITFKDALFSSFNPDVLKRKEVWIPILAGTAVSAGSQFLGNKDNAVWNTGKAYLCGKEVPVALGVTATTLLTVASMTFTGIGEEALFRGIGYEEFKVSYGKIPATLLDAVIFSAVHIPQEINNKMSFSTIATNFAVRATIALFLEWIYDIGGLKSSIAFHMWFNTITFVSQYLLTGGQTADVVSGNINGNTNLNIGFNQEGLNFNFSLSL